MEDRAVDIWPVLLHGEGAKVQQNVGQPTLTNLRPGAVLGRIVGGGNPRGCAGSQDLGSVEGFLARIVAGDDRSRYGVEPPLDEAAMAERVVAAVLMQHNGQNALNPEIFVCLVREGMPIVSTVSG